MADKVNKVVLTDETSVTLSYREVLNQKAVMLFLMVQPLLLIFWLDPLRAALSLKVLRQFASMLWVSFIFSPFFVGYNLLIAECCLGLAVVYVVWTRSKRVSAVRFAVEIIVLTLNCVALHVLGFWGTVQFAQFMMRQGVNMFL